MRNLLPAIHHYRTFNWLFCFLFLQAFISCDQPEEVKKYRVGFSQCTFGDAWRKTMQKEMERELSFHPEINLISKDANLSSEKQVSQIRELLNEGIDLLIVTPNEAAPVTPIVDSAFRTGIPVVVVDRNILSKNYTAFIGADNYKVGLDAGFYASNLLKGKGNVMEIGGLQIGSTADIGRHDGFTDYIKKFPGIKYVNRFIGDWDNHPVKWEEDFTKTLLANQDVQLIFSQNDRLAFAAAKVCKKLGLDKKIYILGIDGLVGENGGIDLVEKGILKATILYPTGGQEAILAAVNILGKKPFKRENDLATTIIDSNNVRIMRLQIEKLAAQQNDIDKRQQRIDEQIVITANQTKIIYAISISLALALIFGSTLFYYLRENKKINARLESQNEEILKQRDQLIELGKKAKEATDAKINFFTNISHEFRTPLTLILGPMEDMLRNPKLAFPVKQSLGLIQKNAIRLLRLINELIDFRKIELEKMQLNATENDLVFFVNEIAESFNPLAKKRNIDFRVISKERSLPVWFDAPMIDKVIFNLLSNALKFTNDNGFIHITLEKDQAGQTAIIKVEDNGVGMTPDVAEHAFELFYKTSITNQLGSGLGLALSKELINLHHGKIMLNSKAGRGTCFEIQLPLGKAHLKETEINKNQNLSEQHYYHERIYTTEQSPVNDEVEKNAVSMPVSDQSLLIIEDNPDLGKFLEGHLNTNFQVMLTDNGITGLQKALEEVPDIIISDVVLPGKDGISITNILKNDIRTSHIPIILLTAKIEVEEQIEGMRNMADAYILKPFNLQLLEATMKSVIKNRGLLREHYTSEISTESKLQSPKKLDRKFINEFTAIVERNIGNETFSIDDICNDIGVSRVQLYRKIKALLGYNINDYILNVRIQKAKYYLAQRDLSISEIAYKVGFATPAYFSTVFKAKSGMTPKEFREK